jgi:DNA-binding MarR family transcriptional regulator
MRTGPTAPRLGLALRRAQYAFRQALESELRPLQISLPLASLLLALSLEDGLSSAALARREAVTAQTMNQTVGGAVERGLVERRPHSTHGRILTLHLTRTGRRALARALELGAGVEARMLADFTVPDRRRLLRDLERCADALAADQYS